MSIITLGKYSISVACKLTDPCRHYVTNSETGVSSWMYGDDIYIILKNDGLSDPHFEEYGEEESKTITEKQKKEKHISS